MARRREEGWEGKEMEGGDEVGRGREEEKGVEKEN